MNATETGNEFQGPVRRGLAAWDRFWFSPTDPTVLGFIRIWCGLITLYVHLAYGYDLLELFGKQGWLDLALANEYRHEAPWVAPATDWSDQSRIVALPADSEQKEGVAAYTQKWGLDPRAAVSKGNAYFSVWFHVTEPAWMQAVHWGMVFVIFLFTVGFCTRITSVLTWLIALCYIQRSQITLFGMDTMMNIALFYLMIGPSGAALSVDRALARVRERRAEPDSALPPFLQDRPEPMASANLAIRLMQVHFCIIYMAAGLSKLMGSSWWNGTALWGTVANYEFTPIRFALYAEALRWICQHRWLWEILMTLGVVYTLVLEISFPFLVWQPRFRGLMVAGSVLLHTIIAGLMGLVGFGLFMMALVMSFIPAEALHEILDGMSWRARGAGPRGPLTGRWLGVKRAETVPCP